MDLDDKKMLKILNEFSEFLSDNLDINDLPEDIRALINSFNENHKELKLSINEHKRLEKKVDEDKVDFKYDLHNIFNIDTDNDKEVN